MNEILPAIFVLLINALGGFLLACIVLLVISRVFRVSVSKWMLGFLLLPLVKIVADLVQGIPESAFLWAYRAGATPDHQSLNIGFGLTRPGVPLLNVTLGANVLGQSYSLAIGDALVRYCDMLSSYCVPILTLIFLGVALVLLARKVTLWTVFSIKSRRQRRDLHWIDERKCGLFRVKIYLFEGMLCRTPFAGGIFRPYIVFPKKLYPSLSPDEREAVIGHELAHIRNFHLPILVLSELATCLFWFIPGIWFLLIKIREQCELLADDEALRKGISPGHLASSLVCIHELSYQSFTRLKYRPQLSFCKAESLLKRRILRMLDSEPEAGPRFGWRKLWFRWWVGISLLLSVLFSAFGGYH